MISHEKAHALGAFLAEKHSAVVIEPSTLEGFVARVTLARAGGLLSLAHVSYTTVNPVGGSLIFLSDDAVKTAVDYACTVAHECQHAHQIDEAGPLQAARDYVEGELRAVLEAHPYTVGAFLAYVLTGELPSTDGPVASLSKPLYFLSAKNVELGRGILESNRASMETGIAPPITVAVEALAWLRKHAPEAIVAEAFRVAA